MEPDNEKTKSLLPTKEKKKEEEKPDAKQTATLVMTTLAVALGSSLQFGFATGSLNNLEQIVPATLAQAGNPITITMWALINSSFSIGGLIGSYGCVPILLRKGPRYTLLYANAFVFLSSALMFYGTVWWVLLLGRISIGVVAGVAQMAAGVYLNEIAPTENRGAVSVCSQLGIVWGIALANILTAPSFHALGSMDLWRYAFLVPSAFSVFQILVLPYCPETPEFLANSGCDDSLIIQNMSKLRRAASIANFMENRKSQKNKSMDADEDSKYTFADAWRSYKAQCILGIVIKIGVQFSGIDAIFYYSTLMFRHANVGDPQLATVLLSFVNLGMTFVAMLVVDLGRKPLIMITWVGMCLGFFIIYSAGTLGDGFGILPDTMANVEVVAMVLIIMSFAVGVGNVEGFIIAEILPGFARGAVMEIAQPLNWIANLTVSTLFPIVFTAIDRNAYLIFVAFTAGFGVFTWTKLPETAKKTYPEVEKEFQRMGRVKKSGSGPYGTV